MDLDELARLGEFVGGFAVIITLAYLAYQTHRTNQFMVRQVRQSVTETGLEFARTAIDNPQLTTALNAHFTGEALSAEADALVTMYMRMFIQMLKNNFYHYQAGLITDDDWAGLVAGYRTLIDTAAFRELAKTMGIGESPDFGAFLETLLHSPTETPVR